ncbi:CRISPR-associated endonuclease Cas3'' [Rubellimicrobium aerolatum]|uniref:CRISPR-associated endonuclease Cas3 n=1 Tax=Rubellimicrobium aerolatum TaxID=490979 RepID=A0ABW0SC51_9RHOB|nr:CRISPR-associated endonuclease Cas3'' [Rubellimicrobium aerolatum]MBP1806253.1 CRISPR-associated endonuclease/helicase Cas3 [Rubellimicrobium aerolatum]
MTIHAHSLTGRPEAEWETLEAHSLRVAGAARARAEVAGLGDLAHLLGLVHDLGKAKPAFQARLRGSAAEVSHSGEGARLLREAGGGMGAMLAGAVAGHHGRLPNPDRLAKRIAEAEAVAAPGWAGFARPEAPERLIRCPAAERAFRAQFLVRFLYGCLTDADDRETGAWEREATGRSEAARPAVLTPGMRAAFDRHVAGFRADTPVNAIRARVLAHVRGMAAEPPGLFTLTVPTGGGKTLASLGFALDHAARHGMRRLIHVAPFTSIVEQTADVFRGILGDDAVLEHHSAFDWDGVDEGEAEQRRVAGMSWDVPVVVTTAVQFFESLFAARKKRCRKLPALAGAVIVVDEAQTMPRGFLRPCLAALRELAAGYGASVVLCTATQPALTAQAGFRAPEALRGARELAPDPAGLHEALRRVRVRDLGAQADADLAARLREARQALLIVDNRVQARRLFDAVEGTEGAAHLSTLMTAAHRRAVLVGVRARLTAGKPVRLVSTSLVEAGVDVDFPLVMRAAAGIDSLAHGGVDRNHPLGRAKVDVIGRPPCGSVDRDNKRVQVDGSPPVAPMRGVEGSAVQALGRKPTSRGCRGAALVARPVAVHPYGHAGTRRARAGRAGAGLVGPKGWGGASFSGSVGSGRFTIWLAGRGRRGGWVGCQGSAKGCRRGGERPVRTEDERGFDETAGALPGFRAGGSPEVVMSLTMVRLGPEPGGPEVRLDGLGPRRPIWRGWRPARQGAGSGQGVRPSGRGGGRARRRG